MCRKLFDHCTTSGINSVNEFHWSVRLVPHAVQVSLNHLRTLVKGIKHLEIRVLFKFLVILLHQFHPK